MSSEEEPIKKKRVADRQITKDDGDADGDGGDEGPDGAFPKADAETLAKRKIVRVKRPTPAASNSDTATITTTTTITSGDDSKPPNPFAAAFSGLSSSGTKVPSFGSSFSGGFGAAAAKGGSGNGTGGFGISPPSAGFGAAATSNTADQTGKGFGGFGIGLGSSTTSVPFGSAISNSKSIFEGSKNSTTESAFGFASNGVDKNTGESTKPVLPDDIEVRNGEEDEECIFEIRVKTFVLVPAEEKSKTDEPETATRPAFSVPASASSLNTSLKTESKKEEEKKDESEKNDKGETNGSDKKDKDKDKEDSKKADTETSNDNNNGDDEKEEVNNNNNNKDTEKEKKEEEKSKQEKVWRERGIGPLKVLRRKSDSLCRIVQRRENAPGSIGTTLLVNLPLRKNCEMSRQSEKHIQISTIGKDGTASLLIKNGKPDVSRKLEMIMKREIEASSKSGATDQEEEAAAAALDQK